jgi:hypothetical protein
MIVRAFAPGQTIRARGLDLRGAWIVERPFITGTHLPKLVYEARHARRGNTRIIPHYRVTSPRLRGGCVQ